MRDEVFSSVCTNGIERSQVSYQEDKEFHREDRSLNTDTDFRHGLDGLFCTAFLNTFLSWVKWLTPDSDGQRGRQRDFSSTNNNSNL